MPRRLVSVGHSYCVALNRRLAHELARASGEAWEVTAVGPSFFHGDLRPIEFEPFPGEASAPRPVPIRGSKRVHVMFYGRELRDLLREPWDLVHCWEEPFIVAGGQVAWWTPESTPLVYATFQNIAKRYPPPFNWIERGAMRRSAGWIAFGETVHETLGRRALYAERPSRVIPPGVDLDRFAPSADARRETLRQLEWDEAGPPVVGYLGRFLPAKGLELLTRALDRVRSPWRALFVGGGPMEPMLREWGARHGDAVRVATGIPHDGVPAYLNAMDLLCAPSQTTPKWREQLGRMLIEAFASGVPVVASDSGEIPFVVADAGVVVGERDEDAWVRELEALLDAPERRAELAERGLERAQSVFAWPVVARRHLDFFEELLASPR